MKKLIYLTSIAIIMLVYSCSNDEYDPKVIDQDDLSAYDVILQERGAELPDKWDREPKPRLKSGSNDFMPDDYLGRSYKVSNGNGIVNDQENTGDVVINTKAIQAGRYSSIVSNIGFGKSINNATSYSSFERFYEKNKTVKKFNSGFELNIKLFKIGHTSKITKTFVNEMTNIKNAVYGEVNAGLTTGRHTLKTDDPSLLRISTDYLDPSFLENLYYTPMSKVLETYGEFVLTGYYTGGVAHALYLGKYNENINDDYIERDMDQTMNASYTWSGSEGDKPAEGTKAGTSPPNGGSVSGNVGWGKNYSRETSHTSKISELYFSFKAIGGEGITTGNVKPYKVDEISINLDSWVKSVSIPKNQKLVEILDGGLTGINLFILEENFKQRFQDTHLDLCKGNEFLKPRIEIVRVPVRMSASKVQLYEIVPVLYTRHGDMFLLQDGKANLATDAQLLENNNEAIFAKKSADIAVEKGKYYQKLGITANFHKIVNPRFRVPLSFRIPGLDESRMVKFYNEATEMWYIYDDESGIAFAFWYDEYILRHYGLTEWFKKLPEEPLNMVSLSRNFKIYGL